MTTPPPAAVDVIKAALTVAVPTDRQDIDHRARLVEAALIVHGHLPDPTAPKPGVYKTYAQAAVWLAEQSQFARYTGPGWERLLESPADVEVAAAKALARAVDPITARAVTDARDLLLARHAASGAPGRRAGGDSVGSQVYGPDIDDGGARVGSWHLPGTAAVKPTDEEASRS